MENKYTGEVPFTVGEMNGVLIFDYTAMAAVKSAISAAEMENLAQLSPDKLAIMAEAGFKKKSPEITAAHVMKASPPIMALANAIDRALLFAFHGPEGAREILEPLDKAAEQIEKAAKKKSAGMK